LARIRYLKPDFFKDEDIAELPFETRLVFAGLWCQADREGRLEDRPKRLKVEIMPYDDIDIEKQLQLLANSKKNSNRPFIVRYEINGEKYIQILNFSKHQKFHSTEKESEIPPYNPPLKGKGKGKGNIKGKGSVQKDSRGYIHVKDTLDNVKNTLKEIIDDLNAVLGTSYKYTTVKTKELIKARLKEGFTIEDFKKVHRKKFAEWGTDNKMRPFLRPQTLYSNKFEAYLNQPEKLPVSQAGAKTLMAGKQWLESEEKKNAK